jgi:ABC-type multidrug transport system fused ATPase/permease subunit
MLRRYDGMIKKLQAVGSLIKDFFGCIANVGTIYKLIWKQSKGYVFFSIFMILTDTLQLFVGLALLNLIVDELTVGKRLNQAIFFVVLMVGINFILNIISNSYKCFNDQKIEQFKINFIFMVQEKAISLSYRQIEDPSLIDDMKKAMEVFYPKQAAFMNIKNTINGIRSLITGIVQILGIAAVLVVINPLLILSLLVVCVISAILNANAAEKEFETWNNSLVNIGRQLGYFQELATNFIYAKELRINKLQHWVYDKMYATAVRLIKGIIITVVAFTLMGILSGTLFTILNGGIYLYLTKLANDKVITIGNLTVYIYVTISFISIGNAISSQVILIKKSGKYIKTFLDFLKIKSEQSAVSCGEAVATESTGEMNIRFEDVWFRYPSKEEYVLTNINLEIESGSKVVIVGENGAGKTTLIKLLLRLYQPTRGAIYLNGCDINKMDYAAYIDKVSAVFQDFKILNFSLLENLKFDKEKSMAEIEKVLDEVGLKEYADSLPNGLDTQMGKIFADDGVELSGGQQQKLAIARALLKKTNLVILDEPTAMLSPLAEYEIYKNFNDLTQGKTAVYISHRLSCCRFCDKIVVLDNGAIVETGNHSELIDKDGIYTKMFNLQAEFYRDLDTLSFASLS